MKAQKLLLLIFSTWGSVCLSAQNIDFKKADLKPIHVSMLLTEMNGRKVVKEK